MKKGYLILLVLSLFLSGCIGYHRIPKDENGELILNEKVNYKFTKIPTEDDLTKIDTSAFYVQVFEDRFYNIDEKMNPMVLIFHKDGYFKRTLILSDPKFTDLDISQITDRNKNSVHYGGKYRITENLIELEIFYPSQGGKTSYYSRNIIKGNIVGDRIIFDEGSTLLSIYEKRDTLD